MTTRVVSIILLMAAWCTPLVSLADLSAAEIVNKSNEVDGGNDTISRLTFTFHKANGSEKRLVYTMAWKKYSGEDGVNDKVIFFSEYPLYDVGKSYMIWVSASSEKQDDEWMYLPELRMVRKVTHDENHHRSDKEDDFAQSVLMQINLVPRKTGLDNHSLFGKDTVDGHDDYVVESVPKQASKNFPYQKTRRWITVSDFLCERIDYYDESGATVMSQTIQWKKIGNAWVWERVVGTNLRSNDRTVLDISAIHLNNNLTDEVFTARSMRLGKDILMK
jgi:Outer membrane lipoprotein-sorting protein